MIEIIPPWIVAMGFLIGFLIAGIVALIFLTKK
jgi:LPS O-antigen subunit length determinant protein (WzzB/FepE family)